jgi:two-component system sensor histidine kinase ChiS
VGYILLAEDDQDSLALIQEALLAQGFTVRAVNNGQAALDLAQTEKPDLLLLDIMMPGLSGLEVTRQVKAHYASDAPPVILITALGSWQDVEQGKLAGADEYIIKPFAPDALTSKIRSALARR